MTRRALLAWWRSDFDYTWLPDFFDRRSLSSALRQVVALTCAVAGVCGVLILSSDQRPASVAAVWGGVILVASAFYAGIRWWTVRWPTERRSLIFLCWADCTLAAVVLFGVRDPSAALAACGLFMIPGLYATLLHSPRIIVGHIGFAVAVGAVAGIRIALATDDLLFLAGQALVVGGVVLLPPAAMQTGLQLLKRDAQTSYRDPLTDLLNRRGLAEGVDKLVAASAQTDLLLVAIVIDLDGFKALNDEHGHDAGDIALRSIAERLSHAVPPDGLLGRLGGDEFAAVVIATRNDVDALAEKVHAAVHSVRDKLPLSASTGVWTSELTSIGAAVRGELFHEMMKRADFAMYEAKRAGGGRIVRQP
ncbi:diguanylate cyclase [Antrihabitans sp. YC2-6]|uniref:GGDEF domain-containing protein n=1 Tax=Antrihabitans sp. YC2-6 TaxID=2799498 RepID=UPI0018F299A2|nr:GGDEF domain-containing protein [Antrihabitans sp. YC2-6]MBJ8343559.1 GGDEF domain-containing protein [Antrihabitans sp. YC2-6]